MNDAMLEKVYRLERELRADKGAFSSSDKQDVSIDGFAERMNRVLERAGWRPISQLTADEAHAFRLLVNRLRMESLCSAGFAVVMRNGRVAEVLNG